MELPLERQAVVAVVEQEPLVVVRPILTVATAVTAALLALMVLLPLAQVVAAVADSSPVQRGQPEPVELDTVAVTAVLQRRPQVRLTPVRVVVVDPVEQGPQAAVREEAVSLSSAINSNNMAHYAKVVKKIVKQVIVAEQDFVDTLKGCWVQTSYNTYGGVHLLGGTPLRKNYAGIGYTYDKVRDAFIAPKPYPSWTLNETTCLWDSPSPQPTDGKRYNWDEQSLSWIEITYE